MGLSGDQGFLVIPAVLTEAEAGTLRIAVETMSRSRAGSRNVLGHPAVRNVAEDRRLFGIAAEFLGGNVFPFKATLFDKSPTTRIHRTCAGATDEDALLLALSSRSPDARRG